MSSYDSVAPASDLEAKPVHIVGLSGSVSANSSTRKVLQLALSAAAAAGAQTTLVKLSELHLPFAASNFSEAEFPDVAALNDLIREADALIWATPEYHGSFSGVLKNALDLGSFDEYSGKAVALLGVAGGQVGAIQALSHLRGVARALHMWCLPRQVSIARAYAAFNEDGTLNDPKLALAVAELGSELARLAPILRAAAQPA